MDLHGTLRYRGSKIYLNRKHLLADGAWKWFQDATSLDKGDEETARKMLAELNIAELAKYEIRAVVTRTASGGLPVGETVRTFARQWIELRKAREFTSAFGDESRFAKHLFPFVTDDGVELGDLPLCHVKPRHVRALVAKLGSTLAPRTVRNIYSMLHAMFEDAYADERVESNPCRLRRGDMPVSEDRNPRWRTTAIFTRDELIALISDRRIRSIGERCMRLRSSPPAARASSARSAFGTTIAACVRYRG